MSVEDFSVNARTLIAADAFSKGRLCGLRICVVVLHGGLSSPSFCFGPSAEMPTGFFMKTGF